MANEIKGIYLNAPMTEAQIAAYGPTVLGLNKDREIVIVSDFDPNNVAPDSTDYTPIFEMMVGGNLIRRNLLTWEAFNASGLSNPLQYLKDGSTDGSIYTDNAAQDGISPTNAEFQIQLGHVSNRLDSSDNSTISGGIYSAIWSSEASYVNGYTSVVKNSNISSIQSGQANTIGSGVYTIWAQQPSSFLVMNYDSAYETIEVDDEIKFYGNVDAIGVVEGQTYYVTDMSYGTMRVSDSLGGSDIVFASDVTDASISIVFPNKFGDVSYFNSIGGGYSNRIHNNSRVGDAVTTFDAANLNLVDGSQGWLAVSSVSNLFTNDVIEFSTVGGAVMPTGITASTAYIIVSVDRLYNKIKVSLGIWGSVSITDVGSGTININRVQKDDIGYMSIFNGIDNTVMSSRLSTVINGNSNNVYLSDYSFIGTGLGNTIKDTTTSVILNGHSNTIIGDGTDAGYHTILNAYSSTIGSATGSPSRSMILGGYNNNIYGKSPYLFSDNGSVIGYNCDSGYNFIGNAMGSQISGASTQNNAILAARDCYIGNTSGGGYSADDGYLLSNAIINGYGHYITDIESDDYGVAYHSNFIRGYTASDFVDPITDRIYLCDDDYISPYSGNSIGVGQQIQFSNINQITGQMESNKPYVVKTIGTDIISGTSYPYVTLVGVDITSVTPAKLSSIDASGCMPVSFTSVILPNILVLSKDTLVNSTLGALGANQWVQVLCPTGSTLPSGMTNGEFYKVSSYNSGTQQLTLSGLTMTTSGSGTRYCLSNTPYGYYVTTNLINTSVILNTNSISFDGAVRLNVGDRIRIVANGATLPTGLSEGFHLVDAVFQSTNSVRLAGVTITAPGSGSSIISYNPKYVFAAKNNMIASGHQNQIRGMSIGASILSGSGNYMRHANYGTIVSGRDNQIKPYIPVGYTPTQEAEYLKYYVNYKSPVGAILSGSSNIINFSVGGSGYGAIVSGVGNTVNQGGLILSGWDNETNGIAGVIPAIIGGRNNIANSESLLGHGYFNTLNAAGGQHCALLHGYGSYLNTGTTALSSVAESFDPFGTTLSLMGMGNIVYYGASNIVSGYGNSMHSAYFSSIEKSNACKIWNTLPGFGISATVSDTTSPPGKISVDTGSTPHGLLAGDSVTLVSSGGSLFNGVINARVTGPVGTYNFAIVSDDDVYPRIYRITRSDDNTEVYIDVMCNLKYLADELESDPTLQITIDGTGGAGGTIYTGYDGTYTTISSIEPTHMTYANDTTEILWRITANALVVTANSRVVYGGFLRYAFYTGPTYVGRTGSAQVLTTGWNNTILHSANSAITDSLNSSIHFSRSSTIDDGKNVHIYGVDEITSSSESDKIYLPNVDATSVTVGGSSVVALDWVDIPKTNFTTNTQVIAFDSGSTFGWNLQYAMSDDTVYLRGHISFGLDNTVGGAPSVALFGAGTPWPSDIRPSSGSVLINCGDFCSGGNIMLKIASTGVVSLYGVKWPSLVDATGAPTALAFKQGVNTSGGNYLDTYYELCFNGVYYKI